MTFVPEDATLCGCWSRATDETRRTHGRNNTAGPRGILGCPKCRGMGFYISKRALEARFRTFGPVSGEMVDAALAAWHDPLPSEMPVEQQEREGMRAALEAALAPSEAAREA